MSKNVQIPQELFFELVRYFVLDDVTEERYKAILGGIEGKVDQMVKHELYTASKTAKTAEEREILRLQTEFTQTLRAKAIRCSFLV